MPSAIDSHSGNDQQRARPSSRPGPPDRAEARGELLGDPREQPGERRRQHLLEPRHASARAAPDRRRARTARPARAIATGAGACAPAHFTAANADRVGARRDRGRTRRRSDASRTSTVSMSSSRSRTIVANAPVALIRSCRARKYGRMTSPARAGSTLLAAKPTAVARNAFAKLGVPSGSSRYCQRRRESPGSRTSSPATAPATPGRACTISRDDAAQIDVVQEQRQQRDAPAPAR